MFSCVDCHSQYPHLHCPESGTPSKVKSSVGLGKKSRLMKTVQTMKGHSNYQNCPGLRSHAPHSNYGTYVTLAPKVLVFPVFVQVSSLLEPSASVPGIKPLWEKMPFHVLRNIRLPLREKGSPAFEGINLICLLNLPFFWNQPDTSVLLFAEAQTWCGPILCGLCLKNGQGQA